MKLSMVLAIADKVGRMLLRHHMDGVTARASLREAWREYQVERYNAELRERAVGKVPYDASIHEEALNSQQGRNPTTRIDLTSKTKTRSEQGS
jgi:hypothetical protein